MRIALFTQGIFPYVFGGMQKHSFNLARHWAQQGVEVDLYYALQSTDNDPELLVEQMNLQPEARLHGVPVARHRTRYFPGHYIWSSYKTSEAILQRMKACAGQPDFIYAQGFAGWKAVGNKRAGAVLPPIGVNFHGLEMYQKPASLRSLCEQWLFRPFVEWNLQRADVALSLGGGLTTLIESRAAPGARVAESANAVDRGWHRPSKPPAPKANRTFVFVGRYERRKGVEELQTVLRSFAAGQSWRFVFVGPIPQDLRLKYPNVTYHGLVKEEKRLQGILQDADVLVCPSYSEGMPTVILEAMASGLAIIASQVGAVDAMVSERNGWLIPPGDTGALRHAMRDALELPADRLHAKQRASYTQVEDFFWEEVAARTLGNIERFLESHRIQSR
jgi:glycosyltransferase involved in cell wall biosynthesis